MYASTLPRSNWLRRGFVYSADADADADFVYSADSWYSNGDFCCFDCLLTVFGTLLVHGWYSLGRHVTIGTPMSFLLYLLYFDFFDHWYTVGTWQLVHQWSFLLFWLSFYCFWLFWRLVHCRYSLGRHVTIGTPMPSDIISLVTELCVLGILFQQEKLIFQSINSLEQAW